MRPIRSIAFSLAALAVLVTVSGCSRSRDWKFADMFNLKKGMPWHDDGPDIGMPTRVVGTWTDTILTQPGKPPQRGFGGRLLFYGSDSSEPIYVDGQLVVYAFDESNREATDNRPTRRYVFPADQVPLHMSESEFGPTYSFWLPWDNAGGPQTDVSLICRFEPKDGPLVAGEQTKHMLPGAMIATSGPPKLPEGVPFKPGSHQALYDAGSNPQANAIQSASYEGQVAGSAENLQSTERRMQTTSISLPQSFRVQGTTPSAQAAEIANRNVRGVSDADMRPASGVIPSAHIPQSPGYAPQQPVIPSQGYPGAPAAPYTPTQMQPISPVGSSAIGSGAAQVQPMPQPWEQILPGQQPQQTVNGGLSTTVTVLSAGESARRRWGQPSSGSTPAAPPAPILPTSR